MPVSETSDGTELSDAAETGAMGVEHGPEQGAAAVPACLHVGRPNIGVHQRFMERVQGILERGWLTNNGPLVVELEQSLADYLGVRNCVATCNGTVALELAIRALGLRGEVLVPSMTFAATVHALQWQEITPVFCDIDRRSYCIDYEDAARLITARTTGILGVHLYGRPCAVDALQGLANRHGLKLVLDAAHAFGCSYGDRMIGNFGDCEVFSFHATKLFNTFEGGAITTNDDELAARLRLMRNFGFAGEDKVVYIGTNGKMTEVCAAMGLTNLESLDEFIEINRCNYAAYRHGLQGVRGIELMDYDEVEHNNYQYVIAEVDEADFGLSRDALQQELHRNHILARRYFHPGCHRMEPYRSLYPDAGKQLPNTEAFAERVLALPTGTQVSPSIAARVCEVIKAVERRARGGA